MDDNSLDSDLDWQWPDGRHTLDDWVLAQARKRLRFYLFAPDKVQNMYERFTDRARRIFQVANQEAQKLNHDIVCSEHVLLGVLDDRHGIAAQVLYNLNDKMSFDKMRSDTLALLTPGQRAITLEKLPHDDRVKKCVGFAVEEARLLGHNYVGTEHVLLALMRRDYDGCYGSLVWDIITRWQNVTLESVRAEIKRIVETPPAEGSFEKKLADMTGKIAAAWSTTGAWPNYENTDSPDGEEEERDPCQLDNDDIRDGLMVHNGRVITVSVYNQLIESAVKLVQNPSNYESLDRAARTFLESAFQANSKEQSS